MDKHPRCDSRIAEQSLVAKALGHQQFAAGEQGSDPSAARYRRHAIARVVNYQSGQGNLHGHAIQLELRQSRTPVASQPLDQTASP